MSLPLLAYHDQSIASNKHNNRVIAKKTKIHKWEATQEKNT
jgi:hypothetical protein